MTKRRPTHRPAVRLRRLRGLTSTWVGRSVAATAAVFSLMLYGCRDTKPTAPEEPSVVPLLAKSGAAAANVAVVGQWSAPFAWGGPTKAVGIHLHLLPNGKVLSWGHSGQPSVWDPSVSSQFTTLPSPSLLFCSGHAFLADGRLVVTGGHDDSLGDLVGVRNVNTFDFAGQSWSALAPLAFARWYPTSMTLPNGEVLTIGGTDSARAPMPIPEIWSNGVSRPLPGASWNYLDTTSSYYPRTFVAPNGKVFYAGEEQQSRWLDYSGTGSSALGPRSNFGRRDYGSAVAYDVGKIMIVGGGYTPTNTAEVIDLNQASPTWRYVGSMSRARRQLNATILADGSVLATGGTSATGFTEESGAVLSAERWNPATGTWSVMASGSVFRVYHSTALLLPDGRVLTAGSGEGSNATTQYTAELYSPPYLFNSTGKAAARPTILSAPSAVSYGQKFFVGSMQWSSVAKVTWIRLGSVTHSFNASQRFSSLPFTKALLGLTVTAPVSANLSPPGHYLLFLIDSKGVPSVAKIVRIG